MHQCNEHSEESGTMHQRLPTSPSILHIIFLGGMLLLLPIGAPSLLSVELCNCQILLSPGLSQTFPHACFPPTLATPVPLQQTLDLEKYITCENEDAYVQVTLL